MKELNFETGLVTYNLNGKCEVSFNPTDSNFVERLYSALEELDKKQEDYKSRAEELDVRTMFDFAQERDAEMREIIDSVFECPVSDALFGNMNVYAVSNGLPVWSNLMLAVIDEVNESFDRERKTTNSRVAKYVAKYQKYRKQ